MAYIVKNLVSTPDEVHVSSEGDQEMISIEIRVAPEDIGKVIGRHGNTINSLRTIVRTVATRLGRKAKVELIQSEQSEEKQPEEAEDVLEEVSEEEKVALSEV
ncbi:MAG: KH domain-containing protein [Chlamydiales bacterium]